MIDCLLDWLTVILVAEELIWGYKTTPVSILLLNISPPYEWNQKSQ